VFTKQDPMRRVVYALTPIFLYSIFLYGWRSIALGIVIFIPAILTELVFEKKRNKKVSEAVLVTAMLLTLSMPPAVPFWVAIVASVFAVLMGKEVYGGFGRNIFNPAITGRIFTYISFPLLMQTTWMFPGNFGLLGMNNQVLGSTWPEAIFVIVLLFIVWFLISAKPESTKRILSVSLSGLVLLIAFYVVSAYTGFRSNAQIEVDVVATATPLELLRGAGASWNPASSEAWLKNNSPLSLLFGFRIGALGEGAVFLIIAAGIYLIAKKTANWKLMLSTLLSALVLSLIFYYSGAMRNKLPLMDPSGKTFVDQLKDLAVFIMSGSLLFVCVFMATDPVSAPKKPLSQWAYGIIIGSVTILVRVFSGFPEGVSFGVLMANMFSPLLDELLPAAKKKAASPKPEKAPVLSKEKEA